uniref:Uncharacterized protein n=1 Tax=Anopheles stephensi TaxID=30069 RepID=A0A182YP91_ANOST
MIEEKRLPKRCAVLAALGKPYNWWLIQIFGYEPNVDYPAYDKIPSGLTFRCADRQPGYYADIETRCQVWHWCLPTGYMFSFLCPNGTVFNQAYRVCDWWTNVNCPESEAMYSINDDLYRDVEGNLIVG